MGVDDFAKVAGGSLSTGIMGDNWDPGSARACKSRRLRAGIAGGCVRGLAPTCARSDNKKKNMDIMIENV
jgi:hypothetical protein